jgi:hypothetical protein
VDGFQNYLELQVSTILRVNIINGIRRSESEYITASLKYIKNTSDIDLASLDQFDKAECMSALGGSV